jgi:hypothetical protein
VVRGRASAALAGWDALLKKNRDEKTLGASADFT